MSVTPSKISSWLKTIISDRVQSMRWTYRAGSTAASRATFTGVALILLGCLLSVLAQNIRDKCLVCDQANLAGGYFNTPLGPVCTECSKLPHRCSLCGLPAKSNFIQTQDGRVICRREAAKVVMNERQAQRILSETSRALIRLTGGQLSLKSRHVSVKVFDVDYWNVKDGEPVSVEMRRVGFTQTRLAGEEMFHSILLLSGRLNSEIAAVCAHELTHAWVNENKASEREIEKETLEAICELVAYKYMQFVKDTEQMERIEFNPYTGGKIQTLLAYEKKYGLRPILHWIASGHGSTLEMDQIYGFTRLLSEKRLHQPPHLSSPKTSEKRPEQLALKGITITANSKMAMINNKLFRINQTQEVSVGTTTYMIRCLKIDENSVTVKVDNNPWDVVLKIGN